MGMDIKKLEEQIRDLPIEGQGAKRDLLPLYADSEAVDALIKYLAEPFHGKVDYVCSPEPRRRPCLILQERMILTAGS